MKRKPYHPRNSDQDLDDDQQVMSRPRRSVGRRALLNALANEYEHGDSLSKLYVSLLARNVVLQEPELIGPWCTNLYKRRASSTTGNLERCGLGKEMIAYLVNAKTKLIKKAKADRQILLKK